jgi:hypothetical protein
MLSVSQLIREDIEIVDVEHLICEMHACLLEIGSRSLTEAGVASAVATGVAQGFQSANDTIKRLEQLAQQTRPVQNFDARIASLIRVIKARLPEHLRPIAQKLVAWGKAHPETQALIIAGLSAAVALALGTKGGAAAGYTLGFVAELLKGARASSAVIKGAKTAAIGAVAGTALRNLPSSIGQQDWFRHAISTQNDIFGNKLDAKDWRGPLAKWLGFR